MPSATRCATRAIWSRSRRDRPWPESAAPVDERRVPDEPDASRMRPSWRTLSEGGRIEAQLRLDPVGDDTETPQLIAKR